MSEFNVWEPLRLKRVISVPILYHQTQVQGQIQCGGGGLWECSPPFRIQEWCLPLPFTNLVYSYTMEETKKCPIYPCTPSFKSLGTSLGTMWLKIKGTSDFLVSTFLSPSSCYNVAALLSWCFKTKHEDWKKDFYCFVDILKYFFML
jgi:hypothetical protein